MKKVLKSLSRKEGILHPVVETIAYGMDCPYNTRLTGELHCMYEQYVQQYVHLACW